MGLLRCQRPLSPATGRSTSPRRPYSRIIIASHRRIATFPRRVTVVTARPRLAAGVLEYLLEPKPRFALLTEPLPVRIDTAALARGRSQQVGCVCELPKRVDLRLLPGGPSVPAGFPEKALGMLPPGKGRAGDRRVHRPLQPPVAGPAPGLLQPSPGEGVISGLAPGRLTK